MSAGYLPGLAAAIRAAELDAPLTAKLLAQVENGAVILTGPEPDWHDIGPERRDALPHLTALLIECFDGGLFEFHLPGSKRTQFTTVEVLHDDLDLLGQFDPLDAFTLGTHLSSQSEQPKPQAINPLHDEVPSDTLHRCAIVTRLLGDLELTDWQTTDDAAFARWLISQAVAEALRTTGEALGGYRP